MNLNSSLMLMQYIVFFQEINLFHPIRKRQYNEIKLNFFILFTPVMRCATKLSIQIFKIERWIK